MSVAFAPPDFQPLLDDLPPELAQRAAEHWDEARRALSPQGLAVWLAGAGALHRLGRGDEVPREWLEATAPVAKEVGEEVLIDLQHALLGLASRTSGGVLALILTAAPTAAGRLRDADLFRAWLAFLGQLLAQAPRALRPLLERQDLLLAQLTLSGLRRWALWGANAHRADPAGLEAYFTLAGKDAQAMLQQERKGTLLVDVQRRLGMYLRALWGRDVLLRPMSGELGAPAEDGRIQRGGIADYVVHLPDAADDWHGLPGLHLYRAAAAHAAAHLDYSTAPLPEAGLTPLQRRCLELFEDARVEALAMARFPGLRALWGELLAVPATHGSLANWFDRLAHVLHDPAVAADTHPLLAEARLRWAEAGPRLAAPDCAVEQGLAFAAALARHPDTAALPFDPRSDECRAPYRDDNAYLWTEAPAHAARLLAAPSPVQVRRRVGLMEFINEVDTETAGDDAQEIWTLDGDLLDDDGQPVGSKDGLAQPRMPHFHPEWDYRLQFARPSWVSVWERKADVGDSAALAAILDANRPLLARLRALIEALQPQGLVRQRHQEDGDDIDLNAAIEALVDLRLGRQPDPRIAIRRRLQVRDLSVLLLVDLSRSTADPVRGGDQTILNLARQAAVLLAEALDGIGDPFAIHGFASNGRHEVSYLRFKDFDGAWDDIARARVAGMAAGLSTRMGAALRHAGNHLAARPSARRLLLVLTDGEPADIDESDPQYLRHDARQAVEGLARQGIATYCLSLDPLADRYVSSIFGGNRYSVLDRVERLPEKLPMLYLGLTR